ncbi:alpha/beta hydrolase [Lysobacter niastensis]|uniref:Alpha/beta fold hydrolase n=1 Tax=Lysobacter niastensis TaxID=380629 RepID=A0ABS0B723_9GAMM|nr:alpha/beta fold hydrolase [Lysobacter niastensis]MBF6024800.1 alpha/beta fold hydrolase [Lysobacter niastensis]
MRRKPLLGLAALPLLGYAAMCVWMFARQRNIIYLARETRIHAGLTDFTLERDGVTLRGWVVKPGLPNPVIYFGGNAERIENRRDQLARLLPGRSIYLLAYRGYGASSGEPTEAGLMGDALALFDHVQAQHPDQPVSVIGTSLGTGVASFVASKRPVARLVLVAPFDCLADVAQARYPLLPVRWMVKDRFDSATHLRGYDGPVMVLRAAQDDVIPVASTNRLISVLARPPHVVELPYADHSTIGSDPALEGALVGFLQADLPQPVEVVLARSA